MRARTRGKHCGKKSGLATTDRAQAQLLREGRITEELVTEVADKVYAMLLLELRVERERYRAAGQGRDYEQGGW